MSTTITFEGIAHNADRALGFASLLRAGTWAVVEPWYISQVSRALDSLVRELGADFLESLSLEEARELKNMLQPTHAKLLQVFKVSMPLRRRVADRTEDLRDIIETLVLRDNVEFHGLMAECELGVKAT
jgi:hypothetical protein